MQFDRILQRLGENRRLLMVGAHPDDEDSDFLAVVARGTGARTGYLSLSRGEGGQNLIGLELGDALGLLRTRELLSARAIDGAEQFFARAYDFGYTRSLEETFGFWPEDSLLKDAVRIVRRFRPDVILPVFSGTPRDGHGQHQASGVIARRAFEVAGDPAVFSELATEEGLEPWTPTAIYLGTRSHTEAATVVLQSGRLDPASGLSYHQIAMQSRSRHRSQDMGRLQESGPRETGARLERSRVEVGASPFGGGIFQGIDARGDWLTALADSLRAHVGVSDLGAAVPTLAAALGRVQAEGFDSYRRDLVARALRIAAGMVIDARADDEAVVPGDSVRVTVALHNGGEYAITVGEVELIVPPTWEVVVDRSGTIVMPGASEQFTFTAIVGEDDTPTVPYFTANQRIGYLYDWAGVDPTVKGLPFQRPVAVAVVRASVLGVGFETVREVTYRYNDQAVGEIRRELRVVPELDVKVNQRVIAWPSNSRDARFVEVSLRNNTRGPISGSVELRAAGRRVSTTGSFAFATEGDAITVILEMPEPPGDGDVQVTAVAVANGQEYYTGVYLIEYPHIRPVPHVVTSELWVRTADMTLPAVYSIGYIRGAADRVPEALRQVGIAVQLIDDAELERGDLSQYEVIVVGSRAYEVSESLRNHNDKLLAYAREGGHLVVLYQQYQFVRGGFAPYDIVIARPHDRITDENAPVEPVDPDHPALNFPNRLVAADWEGWPQERGLYFAAEWDAAYHTVLRMKDPDQPWQEGGLLAARVGAGSYIYTGISFFRALPAGVPGAFRLFFNLIALRPGAAP
ncbi:MAG: PIG-L family deacetylase [Gemmatimonadales bacterium]